MALVLNATPGDPDANSYVTVERAQAYFDSRLPVAGWDEADSQAVLCVMATRLLDAMFSGRRVFFPPSTGVNAQPGYYLVRPTWTGLRAPSNLSRLSWNRIGMYDRNGVEIPEDVYPEELQDAASELAGALGTNDTTLDNDVVVQGLTDIKAGPVALSFAQGAGGAALQKALPESVLDLLVPSWFTEQVVQGTQTMFLEIGSS